MATIAEEQAANARARAEGYESAAHKEMHANVGASSAGYANAVQQEIDANRRAQAEGFANAAAKEMDANRRSIEAGFTSAVDQEIDANRRAREAGYLNAADYESGLRTRSDAPFVDPRTQPAPVIPEQFRIGTANLPQYNVQATPPRMPASGPIGSYAPGGLWGPPIQGGGGYGILGEYLVPPTYTGPASTDPYVMQSSLGPGWGYQYPAINPNGMITGWGGPGGYPGGGYPGGGYPGGGGGGILGPIGPGTGGGGNTTTDASGNQWVMSPDGQWVPASSEYGQGLLGNARLHPAQQYDSSGIHVGTAGGPGHSGYNKFGQSVDYQGNVIPQGTPWQNTFLGPVLQKLGINPVYQGQQSPLLDAGGDVAINPNTGKAFQQTTAPGYDYTMTAADLGLSDTDDATPAASVAPDIAAQIDAMMGVGPNTGPHGSG
jgi:hypothetical protein